MLADHGSRWIHVERRRAGRLELLGQRRYLLAKGAAPSACALTKDHTLKRTVLDGASWSAWSDIAAADAQRSRLSGNADVILWQRNNDLVGLRLNL